MSQIVAVFKGSGRALTRKELHHHVQLTESNDTLCFCADFEFDTAKQMFNDGKVPTIEPTAGIQIRGSNVQVDLQGHTLSQSRMHRAFFRSFSVFDVRGATHVTLQNGTLSSVTGAAIHVRDSTRVHVIDMCIANIERCGLYVFRSAQVSVYNTSIVHSAKDVFCIPSYHTCMALAQRNKWDGSHPATRVVRDAIMASHHPMHCDGLPRWRVYGVIVRKSVGVTLCHCDIKHLTYQLERMIVPCGEDPRIQQAQAPFFCPRWDVLDVASCIDEARRYRSTSLSDLQKSEAQHIMEGESSKDKNTCLIHPNVVEWMCSDQPIDHALENSRCRLNVDYTTDQTDVRQQTGLGVLIEDCTTVYLTQTVVEHVEGAFLPSTPYMRSLHLLLDYELVETLVSPPLVWSVRSKHVYRLASPAAVGGEKASEKIGFGGVMSYLWTRLYMYGVQSGWNERAGKMVSEGIKRGQDEWERVQKKMDVHRASLGV